MTLIYWTSWGNNLDVPEIELPSDKGEFESGKLVIECHFFISISDVVSLASGCCARVDDL